MKLTHVFCINCSLPKPIDEFPCKSCGFDLRTFNENQAIKAAGLKRNPGKVLFCECCELASKLGLRCADHE